jgi:4-amino-4-deoxy-L-arabinose transferase-like glycosyltransferase
MKNRIVPFTCLVLILLLAGILRAWNISENPPELYPDEIFTYLSAKSVVENGRPIQHRLPAYGFASYVSSSLFGENPLGIRAPAVFFGLVSILLVYLLAKEFFRDTAAALFAAFFMAIIPWQIHISRVGWESASFLPFLLLSVYLFIYGINRERKLVLIVSFGMFALTFYTYLVAQLYSLLFLACLLVMYRRYFLRERKVLMTGLIVYFILSAPYFWTIFTAAMFFRKASILFTFTDGINSETLSVFGTNYITHFGPDFLFTHGDPNLRHGAGTGVIYWVMLPFLAAGIVYSAMADRRRNVFYFILFWLAAFPLAASLTDDGVPHAMRSLAGAPVICLLSGRGVSGLVRTVAGRAGRVYVSYILYAVVVIISLVPLYGFSKTYYGDYPVMSAPDWEYGRKKLFSGIRKLEGNYKRICTPDLHFFDSFYLIEFYLPDTELELINNIDDPRCALGGSIVVQDYRVRKYWNSKLVGKVNGPDGTTLYYVFTTE